MATAATTLYYFLVGAHGMPHEPAVLTTQTPVRHVGEVIVLVDGSRVRVLAIEPAVDGGGSRRGLDGVLVVEPHAGA